MRPVVVTAGPLAAASANAIVTSVTPTSGTALTLTTSPYVMDAPRQVLLTYGNEGSARTLLVTGTNSSGNTISETLAVPSGAGGTVATVLSYKTVTSLLPAGAGWTAAATVGTNGVGSSPWVFTDSYVNGPTTITCEVTGTANYTVQYSADDPNSPSDPVAPANMVWFSSPVAAMVAASTTQFANLDAPPAFIRVQLNSGSGSVRTVITQFASPT